MATKKKKRAGEPSDAELLAKLLTVQLHSMGATQDQIARIVGKGKLWVNTLLDGVPRTPKGTANGK
jgi:hypothetical protein